jgi:predicted nucleic acid-binding protein
VDFLNGVPTAETVFLRGALGFRPVVVGDLILCEVRQGVRDAAAARRVERELRRGILAEMMTAASALEAAANVRRLRARGITLRKTVDLLIGTCLSAREPAAAPPRPRPRLRRDGAASRPARHPPLIAHP